MPRRRATGLRVVFPIRHPGNRQLATQRAASVRSATRGMFPDDDRYLKAFDKVRLGDIAAAFDGDSVLGVLLIQRRGRDVFNTNVKRFRRLYGPVRGLWLYWRYRLSQHHVHAGDFYLASIWVGKKARNAGIGAQLVTAVTSTLGGRWTVLARNEDAARFFTRQGFTRRRDPHGLALRLITRRIPMQWDGGPVKQFRKKRRWKPSRAPDAQKVDA